MLLRKIPNTKIGIEDFDFADTASGNYQLQRKRAMFMYAKRASFNTASGNCQLQLVIKEFKWGGTLKGSFNTASGNCQLQLV